MRTEQNLVKTPEPKKPRNFQTLIRPIAIRVESPRKPLVIRGEPNTIFTKLHCFSFCDGSKKR